MKELLVLLTMVSFLFACNSKPGSGESSGSTMTNYLDSVSYCVGMHIAIKIKDDLKDLGLADTTFEINKVLKLVETNLKERGLTDLNKALIKKAIEDIASGSTPPFKPEQAMLVFEIYMEKANRERSGSQ